MNINICYLQSNMSLPNLTIKDYKEKFLKFIYELSYIGYIRFLKTFRHEIKWKDIKFVSRKN